MWLRELAWLGLMFARCVDISGCGFCFVVYFTVSCVEFVRCLPGLMNIFSLSLELFVWTYHLELGLGGVF